MKERRICSCGELFAALVDAVRRMSGPDKVKLRRLIRADLRRYREQQKGYNHGANTTIN